MNDSITFRLTSADVASLERARTLTEQCALFEFEGTGAGDTLQGLHTNDVRKLLAQQACWGAFLTPKGMIITDAWVLRGSHSFFVAAPLSVRQTLLDLWKRTVPPRLSRVIDRSDERSILWGTISDGTSSASQFRPVAIAPFPQIGLGELNQAAAQADAALIAWRKLQLGWPTLGREIDERTLPQEVRFDALDGVRYDKGCYTGQETVARLHFRGHANRLLRGLLWDRGDARELLNVDVELAGKPVGTLRTIGEIDQRRLALAVLRREVQPGDLVGVGGTDARVVELPFGEDLLQG